MSSSPATWRELGEPYMRDGQVRLRDAILASCAAPLYFDPRQVGEYLLADGGLWANNPAIIAVTEAMAKFRRPHRQDPRPVSRNRTYRQLLHPEGSMGPP